MSIVSSFRYGIYIVPGVHKPPGLIYELLWVHNTPSSPSLSLSPSLPASTDQVQSRREGATRESRVFFIDSTRRVNQHLLESTVPSVNFRGLMDPSPFQIADQTPMETVVEMFRKMGLRQVLVSHNG